ncbi:BrnT family toxin [Aureimonas glaciei]|uniref:BrnT family toxin n=1 Tax=Aureimonas glaciei TaxID=1776957 RepID=UPI00166667FA|nr:BrnT family toxin [Aureimonas glaciei]
MRITFDPAKRARTLQERGLDFADAGKVFAGKTLDRPDVRQDCGEERIVTVGHLASRMVVLVWTPRGDACHIISMRKANDREQARYEAWLD